MTLAGKLYTRSQMWILLYSFLFLSVTSWSWRIVPQLSSASSPDHRWKLRHELDMLGRFTGHDQWDKYTKNWMRQHASRRIIHIGTNEKITSLRIIDRGHRLAILSDKRRWEFDLLTGNTIFQHRLRDDGQYMLSANGHRLYCTTYEPSINCHVLKCNGAPMLVSEVPVYHVTESVDGETTCVGLCSESVLVATLDDRGSPVKIHKFLLDDVALASAARGRKVFHGFLGGSICVRDRDTGEVLAEHKLRRLREVPSVRSLGVDMFGFQHCIFVGCQDGTVRGYRYCESHEQPDFTEISSRDLHRSPVTKIRCNAQKVASGDEEGNVMVTDMHFTKLLYKIKMEEGPGDVCFDLNRRFLVIGKGNVVHVWDHDVVEDIRRPFPGKNGGGGGGRSVMLLK